MRYRSKTKAKLKKLIREFRLIQEEGSVVGGGAIAGAGIGPQGEPGVHPSDQPKIKKKKIPDNLTRSPVIGGFRRSPPKL